MGGKREGEGGGGVAEREGTLMVCWAVAAATGPMVLSGSETYSWTVAGSAPRAGGRRGRV